MNEVNYLETVRDSFAAFRQEHGSGSKKEISEEDFMRFVNQRFDDAWRSWAPNFCKAREDLEFLQGDQWAVADLEARVKEERPCLVINTLSKFVNQYSGRIRKNRYRIRVSGTERDDVLKFPDIAGGKDYTLAEIMNGLVDQVSEGCKLESQINRVFDQMFQTGWGWFRIYTKYASVMDFEPEIWVEAVPWRFSVVCDPMATAPGRVDMNYCFIETPISMDEFKMNWPDAEPGDFAMSGITRRENSNARDYYNLSTSFSKDQSCVRIYDYWVREPAIKFIVKTNRGAVYDFEKIEPVVDEMMANGEEIVNARTVQTHRVYRYRMTSKTLLEKRPIEWPGSTIPMVCATGLEHIMRAGEFDCRGIIRETKDPSQAKNVLISNAVEKSSLVPRTRFLVDNRTVEDHKNEWADIYSRPQAYLPYTFVPEIGNLSIPQVIPPDAVPANELAITAEMVRLLEEITGIYSSSIGRPSNETSGTAIRNRDENTEHNIYLFVNHLNEAIECVGRILIELIPMVYTSQRVVRIKSGLIDEEDGEIAINDPILDQQSQTVVNAIDLGAHKYDLRVETVAGFGSQREENLASLMELIQYAGDNASYLLDLAFNNMEMEGRKEAVARAKKLLPPHLLTEQEKARYKIQPPPPDPQAEAEMQKTQAEIQKIQSEIELNKAQTIAAQRGEGS